MDASFRWHDGGGMAVTVFAPSSAQAGIHPAAWRRPLGGCRNKPVL